MCVEFGIEHRLSPLRHFQSNGRVERFNGPMSELLMLTRFTAKSELESALVNYLLDI